MTFVAFSCEKPVDENEGNIDTTGGTVTFTASLDAASKVAIGTGAENRGKVTWTGNEYILISNGSSDITVDKDGNISGEGAEWITAASGTISLDKKQLKFTTLLEAGEKWYFVVTDAKTNIASLSSKGVLSTNVIDSSDGGTVRHIGYATAESSESASIALTFKNVMSYMCFTVSSGDYYAVTIQAGPENGTEFCQSVSYNSSYVASTGSASSAVFSVRLTGPADTYYFVPVTPLGKWETGGLEIKLWDEAGYNSMDTASPADIINVKSFTSAVNTVVYMGDLSEQTVDPIFEYTVPEAVSPVDPQLFSSLGGTRWFSINSNISWTASVNAATTASGVVLSASEGEGSVAKFTVTAGPNTDFESRKTIVIDLVPDPASGLEAKQVTLSQEKGSIMTLEFCSQDGTEALWPFAEEANTTGGGGTSGTYTLAGYSFAYSAADSNYSESEKACWLLGKVGSYISTPAVEGYRLSKASIYDINGTAAIAIQDAEGNDVTNAGQKDLGKKKNTSWTLSASTAGNTSYRYMVVNNSNGESKTLRIQTLTMTYEKVSDVVFIATIPSKVLNVNPDTFNSLGIGSRWFSVSSNVPWTASVNTQKTTASDVKLMTTSGEGDLDKFEVTVGKNTDLDNEKTIVIDFMPQGGQTVSVTLKQDPGRYIRLEFCNQDASAGLWPFNEESSEKLSGTYTAAGYNFVYNAVNSSYFENDADSQKKRCWVFGKADSYIISPVIEGRKLVKVRVIESNGGAKLCVKTADGATEVSSVKSTDADTMESIALTSSEAGISYRLQITNAKTLRIKTLFFEYE